MLRWLSWIVIMKKFKLAHIPWSSGGTRPNHLAFVIAYNLWYYGCEEAELGIMYIGDKDNDPASIFTWGTSMSVSPYIPYESEPFGSRIPLLWAILRAVGIKYCGGASLENDSANASWLSVSQNDMIKSRCPDPAMIVGLFNHLRKHHDANHKDSYQL